MNGSFVVILWPLVVLIVGLLMYAFATNPKLQECGRIAYFVGLLWLVYDFAARVVRL